jgi:hypothetical protein
MTAEQKFTMWLIGATVCFLLAVIVSVTEGPRWAVGPLIILALICCVGMINNALSNLPREGTEQLAPLPNGQATPSAAQNAPAASEAATSETSGSEEPAPTAAEEASS